MEKKERSQFEEIRFKREDELVKVALKDSAATEFKSRTRLERFVNTKNKPPGQTKSKHGVAAYDPNGVELCWQDAPNQICLRKIDPNQPHSSQNTQFVALKDLTHVERVAHQMAIHGGGDRTEEEVAVMEWYRNTRQKLINDGYQLPYYYRGEEEKIKRDRFIEECANRGPYLKIDSDFPRHMAEEYQYFRGLFYRALEGEDVTKLMRGQFMTNQKFITREIIGNLYDVGPWVYNCAGTKRYKIPQEDFFIIILGGLQMATFPGAIWATFREMTNGPSRDVLLKKYGYLLYPAANFFDIEPPVGMEVEDVKEEDVPPYTRCACHGLHCRSSLTATTPTEILDNHSINHVQYDEMTPAERESYYQKQGRKPEDDERYWEWKFHVGAWIPGANWDDPKRYKIYDQYNNYLVYDLIPRLRDSPELVWQAVYFMQKNLWDLNHDPWEEAINIKYDESDPMPVVERLEKAREKWLEEEERGRRR
jgi:hypothetical protein